MTRGNGERPKRAPPSLLLAVSVGVVEHWRPFFYTPFLFFMVKRFISIFYLKLFSRQFQKTYVQRKNIIFASWS